MIVSFMFIFDSLSQQKNRKFIGTTELAAAATEILLQMGAVQERGTVKDVIEERTVRYYQTEGLLETPTEKKGTASVFGYKHLLTLIVIKTLQSQHLPIRKIKEIIRGMSEGELETVHRDFSGNRPLQSQSGQEAREYLEGLSESAGWEPRKRGFPSSDRVMLQYRSLRSDETELPNLADAVHLSLRRSEVAADERSSTWTRHEIAPGVELHVSQEVELRLGSSTIGRLLEKIRKLGKLFDSR